MYFIPLGVDCGNTDLLKKLNIRIRAFPFDWIVTYNGVSDIFKNNFQNFCSVDNNKFNKQYNILFVHNIFPKDFDKINRRINRLNDILNSKNEEIIFIRKGHAPHHHKELCKYCNTENLEIKSDITDCEELYLHLKDKYPNLNFKIILFLVCGNCYNNSEYKSKYNNLNIINIATPIVDDIKYINECSNILNKLI